MILLIEIVMVILRICVIICNYNIVEVKKIGIGFESIYKFNKNVYIIFFFLKGVKNYFII